jgi:hypothetical protein
LGNPAERDRDSGMTPNAATGEPEPDFGMKANTHSAMKPNSFMATPKIAFGLSPDFH